MDLQRPIASRGLVSRLKESAGRTIRGSSIVEQNRTGSEKRLDRIGEAMVNETLRTERLIAAPNEGKVQLDASFGDLAKEPFFLDLK